MRRGLWAWTFCLAFACAGAAGLPSPPGSEDATRQILVLLHLPPEHFRPDAGYTGAYATGTGHAARRVLAQQLAQAHGLTLLTDWPMQAIGVDCYVMQLLPGDSPARSAQQVAQALSRDPRVAWAQPMNLYRAQGAESANVPRHNDPLYPLQPAAQFWRLAELHELATGRNVTVAIVDSGVEQAHPDLARQVVVAENFVDGRSYVAERHGTAVAGIIGALADNRIGIAGVAPEARLMALRACWQASRDDTLCTSLGLAKAIHFAITQHAEIVNLSLSGPKDRLLAQLLDAALARGITVVAAADAALADGGFPASHPGVWAVTDRAPGPRTEALRAPGQDVPTTVPGGGWQFLSGASFAAAHVAGLMALLRQLDVSLAAGSAQPHLVKMPAGDIDTCATLLHVVGSRQCSCAATRSRTAEAPAVPSQFDQPGARPASHPAARPPRRTVALLGRRVWAGRWQYRRRVGLSVSWRVLERRGPDAARERFLR